VTHVDESCRMGTVSDKHGVLHSKGGDASISWPINEFESLKINGIDHLAGPHQHGEHYDSPVTDKLHLPVPLAASAISRERHCHTE
jgi:hypothetical protein